MKKLAIGILAHVDAGKTTLSESILYLSGKIRKLGRVDNKDAFLDTNELERARGITIFSKQAVVEFDDIEFTLLDTPGHVDFSAEMERTLQVLDYAILVISGADGIQGHTKTLWNLLEMYNIPSFIFINKMDQNGTEKNKLIYELKKQLSDGCIEFGVEKTDDFYDEIAMCEDYLMEEYLDTGQVSNSSIKDAVYNRNVFPCYFGSALKLEGVEAFIRGIIEFTQTPYFSEEFGAKVFKITRDDQGNRLTHLKVTGGSLKVKDTISNGILEDKINQIRIYSGAKFETASEVCSGTICAVTGLNFTKPGEGLGIEEASEIRILEPVLSYKITLPEGTDPRLLMPKLRQLEEEEPELNIVWNEQLQEIQAKIMGEVQLEILQSIINKRFGVLITFDEGCIVYKETILNVVEGVGHFEPLRHYAEVHLLLEPMEMGSGLQFDTNCSEDILGKNWQRLILNHLSEKTHKGVLTGSDITDMKITLVSGRAHNKHTEGGDFREATYRAVRQGLKEAESVLLEPYYSFQLEVPEKMLGRAMMDIEKMYGTSELKSSDGEIATLVGKAPVSTMRNYQQEVIAYTKGHGRLFASFIGYSRCHNESEVIGSFGYDSERDIENPTGSIFCEGGSGYFVEWNQVKNHMHIESYLKTISGNDENKDYGSYKSEAYYIGADEIDEIINRTFYANQGKKSVWKRRRSNRESYSEPVRYVGRANDTREEYLLVDGYNVIFAWPELAEIAKDDMDGARVKLLDALSNYQGVKNFKIIVVFDAYLVEGHREEVIDYHNIHMVFTKEAQTADQYIEKFAHDNQKKYNMTVATSDGLQQIIIRGSGCNLISARELKVDVENAVEKMRAIYNKINIKDRNYLSDSISDEAREKMEKLRK